ncbi:hypothetical protein [Dactylosporangium sp. CA-139066]|uniref:hypothetical protein n=1 Tax=Dactylosporangium sp. CA-139066 TaxID=3239930 RepID=UPI003D923895
MTPRLRPDRVRRYPGPGGPARRRLRAAHGSDGFIIGSHLTPTGLDEFVARVGPLLRERGSLRTEYEGTTLRDDPGLRGGAVGGSVPAVV